MIYVRLFYEFFVIGLFTIGGGLATLPLLEDLGRRTGWFSSATLADMLAISESTPGPIGVNIATYAGFISSDVLGGIVATLGLITPSAIIVIAVSKLLAKFSQNSTVQSIFSGIRPASAGLVCAAWVSITAISIFSHNAINPQYSIIFLLASIAILYVIFKATLKIFNNTNISITATIFTASLIIVFCIIYRQHLPFNFDFLPVHSIIFVLFVILTQKFKAIHPTFIIVLGAILGAVLKL